MEVSRALPPARLDTRAFSSSVFGVHEQSQVGAVRRFVGAAADALGFGEVEAAELAIVATEAATNLIKHGGGGELLVRGLELQGRRGLELIALDTGRGIADVVDALVDGRSTAGTLGGGLGAMRRLSSVFDVYSDAGGTALLSQHWPQAADRRRAGDGAWRWGGVCAPLPGEDLPGDAWAVLETPDGLTALVADGLGHGPHAREAALAALEVVRARPDRPAAELLAECHQALRATRGAAVAVARIDPAHGAARFAGIGNITGVIIDGGRRQAAVSLGGIVGHGNPRIRELAYRWEQGALLVLASDGLATRWTLEGYPGLAARHPSLIGGILYRDHRRGKDDVTVVAVRANGRASP
jgi:anti-sigma regulatory factor (Ser/Thr protein kinase)